MAREELHAGGAPEIFEHPSEIIALSLNAVRAAWAARPDSHDGRLHVLRIAIASFAGPALRKDDE